MSKLRVIYETTDIDTQKSYRILYDGSLSIERRIGDKYEGQSPWQKCGVERSLKLVAQALIERLRKERP